MSKPIIIAEFCQNHNGSEEILLRMLESASKAGATYAKLQSIRSKNLTYRVRFEDGNTHSDGTDQVIKRPYREEKVRLESLDLNLDQEAAFVDACKAFGIKSMTTVFDRCTVPEISTLGFDAVKVASYDCGSIPLINDLCERFRCLFLSTGASTEEEILETTRNLKVSGVDVHLMHCVTVYPTPKESFHLARMMYLKLLLPNVGLSSHPSNKDIGITADKIALALGADAIERHFTVLPESQTRDGPVSIDPNQLTELCEFAALTLAERADIVRAQFPDWPIYLGSAIRKLSQAELLNRDYYRGRFASPDGRGGWIYNWEKTPVPDLINR